jgi:hypothetical protein
MRVFQASVKNVFRHAGNLCVGYEVRLASDGKEYLAHIWHISAMDMIMIQKQTINERGTLATRQGY